MLKKNNENKKNKKKSSNKSWRFLIIVIILYLTIYFIYPQKQILVFNTFIKLLLQILPIFLLVYLFLVLINYFSDNKTLKNLLGESSGLKGWLVAIIAGIISVGPIYAWYPLMKDLQSQGVKNRFLASFLYNRGIKLQWIPILVSYFGWTYSLTLFLIMAFMSIPQGIITEKLSK